MLRQQLLLKTNLQIHGQCQYSHLQSDLQLCFDRSPIAFEHLVEVFPQVKLCGCFNFTKRVIVYCLMYFILFWQYQSTGSGIALFVCTFSGKLLLHGDEVSSLTPYSF